MSARGAQPRGLDACWQPQPRRAAQVVCMFLCAFMCLRVWKPGLGSLLGPAPWLSADRPETKARDARAPPAQPAAEGEASFAVSDSGVIDYKE